MTHGAIEPANTLQAELRAARARAMHKHTRDFAIPGYGGRLWGTFRALDDYAEVRKIVLEHRRVPDEAEGEVLIAADTLVKSCDSVYAVRHGERTDLGMTLGRQLAEFLGEPVENDRQAIFAIFPDTLTVMSLYGEIDRWIRAVGVEADEETAGKSQAASV